MTTSTVSTSTVSIKEMITEVKIKGSSTVGSQISRVKTLLKSERLAPQYSAQGIGSKAIATCIIACSNNGVITNIKVEPYTNEDGHATMKAVIQTDSKMKPNDTELEEENYWNVCVPDAERGQTMQSSCRALNGKLSDLKVDDTMVIRGAGQAIALMIVFVNHINTDWGGCIITKFNFRNNVIANKKTGRKNKK